MNNKVSMSESKRFKKDDFARDQLIRMLLDQLEQFGYTKTCQVLKEESRIQCEDQLATIFRHQVLCGQWHLVDQLLDQLKLSQPSNLKAIKFYIGREKYLELLDSSKVIEAVQVLQNELQPLISNVISSHDIKPKYDQHLHQLALCLAFSSTSSELRQFSQWSGPGIVSRTKLLDDIHPYLPRNMFMPKKRLNVLLQQAIQYQEIICAYKTHYNEHLRSTSTSLQIDSLWHQIEKSQCHQCCLNRLIQYDQIDLFQDHQCRKRAIRWEPRQVLREHSHQHHDPISFNQQGQIELKRVSSQAQQEENEEHDHDEHEQEEEEIKMVKPIEVHVIQFSTNGKRLATGASNGTIIIYSVDFERNDPSSNDQISPSSCNTLDPLHQPAIFDNGVEKHNDNDGIRMMTTPTSCSLLDFKLPFDTHSSCSQCTSHRLGSITDIPYLKTNAVHIHHPVEALKKESNKMIAIKWQSELKQSGKMVVAISWHPHHPSLLLVAYDHDVSIWNINQPMKPWMTWSSHQSPWMMSGVSWTPCGQGAITSALDGDINIISLPSILNPDGPRPIEQDRIAIITSQTLNGSSTTSDHMINKDEKNESSNQDIMTLNSQPQVGMMMANESSSSSHSSSNSVGRISIQDHIHFPPSNGTYIPSSPNRTNSNHVHPTLENWHQTTSPHHPNNTSHTDIIVTPTTRNGSVWPNSLASTTLPTDTMDVESSLPIATPSTPIYTIGPLSQSFQPTIFYTWRFSSGINDFVLTPNGKHLIAIDQKNRITWIESSSVLKELALLKDQCHTKRKEAITALVPMEESLSTNGCLLNDRSSSDRSEDACSHRPLSLSSSSWTVIDSLETSTRRNLQRQDHHRSNGRRIVSRSLPHHPSVMITSRRRTSTINGQNRGERSSPEKVIRPKSAQEILTNAPWLHQIEEPFSLTSCSLSLDGRYLVVSTSCTSTPFLGSHAVQKIMVFDVIDKRKIGIYEGQKQSRFVIRAALGGPLNQYLASGSEDSQVYIWEQSDSVVKQKLQGHTAVVNGVAWHPREPNWLVSASDDQTVRLWRIVDEA